MPDVSKLKDEENKPVDGCYERVKRESCVKVPVLLPDPATCEMVVMRAVESVVCEGL